MPDNMMKKPHILTLDNRKLLTLSGVEDVPGFDEQTINIKLCDATLVVKGASLHISKLNLESGDVVIDGKVYELDESKPVYIPGKTTEYPTFTDNTYVVAKLSKEVTITFRYGENGEEYTVKDRCLTGRPLSLYTDPLVGTAANPGPAYRDGYNIVWYRGNDPVPDNYKLQETDDNAVFDARYTEQVTVKYRDEDGNEINDKYGNLIEDIIKDVNTKIGELPEPAETIGEGAAQRHFMGWFDSNGIQYTADTLLTKDVTLTAKYGYKVTFRVPKAGTTGQYDVVDERLVVPNTSLGWLPAAPYRVGYSFRNWTLGDAGDPPVSSDYVVTGNVTITGHYDDISIYTVTVEYQIQGEENPTDKKILSVDKNTLAASPVEVESPKSFTKGGIEYYPVMQVVKLIESNGQISVDGIREGVTIRTPDSSKPEEITVNVLYQLANASYTVQHRLLKLGGNKDNDSDYDTVIETVTDNRAADGAMVYPEINNYPYASYERRTPGTASANEVKTFYVYYTRNSYQLTYNTQTTDVRVSPETALYGSSITLPTPERTGYTFAGWYTDADCTQGKEAGSSYTLKADTTLYAKWTAARVNYTIVYMFERYNDTGTASSFVYDSSRVGTGNVGTTVYASDRSIPTITRTGWEKDTDKNATSSVEIKADGSSVLFVYYKLREYTLNFNRNNRGWIIKPNGTTTTSTYSFNVKLGQDISSLWPSADSNERYFVGWQKNGQGTRYITKQLIMNTDLLPTSGNSVTYYADWSNNATRYTVNYYLQNADDNGYTRSETYSQIYYADNSTLSPKAILGYTFVSRDDNDREKTFNFYYNRDTYKIDYYYCY